MITNSIPSRCETITRWRESSAARRPTSEPPSRRPTASAAIRCRCPTRPQQPIFHKSITAKRVQTLQEELTALKKESEEGRAAVLKAVAEGKSPEGIFTLRDALRIFWRSGAIEGQLEKVGDDGRALPLAMGTCST